MSAFSERLRQASDEVLLRLGRNLLLFQRIEGNLKRLLPNRSISGSISRFIDTWREHVDRAQRKTLGVLSGEYARGEAAADRTANTSLDEPHLSIDFRLDRSNEDLTSIRIGLQSLVESRNALVHLFLERHDLRTLEECERAQRWLDEQHTQALELLHALRFECYALGQGMKHFSELVQSPEFQTEFERAWLQASPLIHAFGHAFKRLERDDGWSVFQTAASQVRSELPDEIAHLKTRYGHRSLKAFILASQLFETKEEPTRAGSRLLFRISPDWTFESAEPTQAPLPEP